MRTVATVAAICVSIAVLSGATSARSGVDWPSFRGISALGIGDGFPTATTWDVPAGKGVKWKTRFAGLSHSSPIVWRDIVCLTTAISASGRADLKIGLYGDVESVEDGAAQTWKVQCLDKRTGKMKWEHAPYTGVPKIKRHPKATHANSTLATDGTHIIAFFGSEGLFAYDMSGKLLWKRDQGVQDAGFFMAPDAQWGTASSPVIHEGKIILQSDVQKNSFIAALDVKTGRELWRTPRTDVPTWSTPTVHVIGGRPVVLANGWKHIGGYDANTGKEVWKLTGGGDIPVPTPFVAHALIFITNAHGPMSPVYAIRTTATGDISLENGATSNPHIAWSVPRDGAYLITPIVYGDYLYVTKSNGVLNVFEAKTGRKMYQQRLGDGQTGFTASPVAADGKVYFPSEEGDVYVVKAGGTFELLAKNALGEIVMATPAISEGVLFFRGRTHLIAIGG